MVLRKIIDSRRRIAKYLLVVLQIELLHADPLRNHHHLRIDYDCQAATGVLEVDCEGISFLELGGVLPVYPVVEFEPDYGLVGGLELLAYCLLGLFLFS